MVVMLFSWPGAGDAPTTAPAWTTLFSPMMAYLTEAPASITTPGIRTLYSMFAPTPILTEGERTELVTMPSISQPSVTMEWLISAWEPT